MDYFLLLQKLILNLCNKKWKSRQKSPKKAKKGKRQKKISLKYRLTKFEKYQLVSKISVVINHRFPDFFGQLADLPDHREKHFYEVKELIFSGLLMFLFNQKSRNNTDNTSKNEDSLDNIQRIFGVRVPVMDTVDLFLRKLDSTELENVKQDMFRELVKSKVLQKFKFNGEYFMLAVASSEKNLRSFCLIQNFIPYCPLVRKKKELNNSAFEKLNKKKYSQNWTENLLIATSIQNIYIFQQNTL